VRKFFNQALATAFVCGVLSSVLLAQTTSDNQRAMSSASTDLAIPSLSTLSCAGYIENGPVPNRRQIIGGEQEQEQRTFSTGDVVYINVGSENGIISVGTEYSVVRPRGQFRSPFTQKRGFLGVFTQEVGRLRVTQVRGEISVAVVMATCNELLLGDLLRADPLRAAPTRRDEEANLVRFAAPTGKQMGRIVLAGDGREMVSRDQIVYIDLGTEDNVRAGEYLTIFRPVGTGNISRRRFNVGLDREPTENANRGFESDTYRGGPFSNQSQRVRRPNETGIYGPNVTTPEVRANRAALPRKIVGEMVILSVQRRTAAAIITRVAEEVHTGDYVEVQ